MKALLFSTFALSSSVTWPGVPCLRRRSRACAKASSNSFSLVLRVMVIRSLTLSSLGWNGSWRPAKRPSVFSRMMSRSIFPALSGPGTPG